MDSGIIIRVRISKSGIPDRDIVTAIFSVFGIEIAPNRHSIADEFERVGQSTGSRLDTLHQARHTGVAIALSSRTI